MRTLLLVMTSALLVSAPALAEHEIIGRSPWTAVTTTADAPKTHSAPSAPRYIAGSSHRNGFDGVCDNVRSCRPGTALRRHGPRSSCVRRDFRQLDARRGQMVRSGSAGCSGRDDSDRCRNAAGGCRCHRRHRRRTERPRLRPLPRVLRARGLLQQERPGVQLRAGELSMRALVRMRRRRLLPTNVRDDRLRQHERRLRQSP
jgi:hypothetical protein